MSDREPLRRLLIAAAAMTVALLAVGCASNATLHFNCDREINGGLELTIDVVQITESEEQDIREVGDEWFYSDLRERLGARRKTISVEGGCRRTLSLARIKGFERLAVIADYQFEGSQDRTRMQFRDWEGAMMELRVLDRHLTISRSR